MKNRYLLFILFAIAVGFSVLIANQDKEKKMEETEPAESALRFIKNKGQWDADIEYLIHLNGGDILMKEGGLTYAFYELPPQAHLHPKRAFGGDILAKNPNAKINGHVLKVDFLGANESPSIIPAKKAHDYHNYFLGNDQSKWAGKVPLYSQLTYEKLYPNIDFRMYGNGDEAKYDMIVKPGGDPSMIQLGYQGADELYLRDGDLIVKTSIRTVIEEAPYAYQEVNGVRLDVPCRYVLTDSVVTFEFPEGYRKDRELIIDPSLIFSTYTGAFGDNWGFTATYDTAGNLYAGGIIFALGGGSTSYPVTAGAFQRIFRGGGTEATITKFNSTGNLREYSTYLGGNSLDQPQSLVVNNQGELYIYGRTQSNNFPVTSNSYDPQYNNDWDIFVAKLDSTGANMLACTYLGGTGSDGENGNYFNSGLPPTALQANYGDDARGEIILDDLGNVYIAACTKSNNFPVNANSFQPFFGGSQDGLVVKMTSDLSAVTWASFFGGSGLDAAYGLKLDNSYNVYVTGGTTSRNLNTSTGALNRNYIGGTVDGYVAKISSNGRNLLNATYIGTNSYDQSYFLELDDDFNVYITGQTQGTYPVIGTVYSNVNSRQFITKLTNDLSSIIYSTTFGSPNASTPNISPTAFLVDRCENVYVAGWGGSTNYSGSTSGMVTTADALQRNTDGSDFYIIVLERDARGLLYATYLGGNNAGGSGEHVDGGTCRFDREGIVYHAVCAGCGGFSTFPTTPGVVSNTNNSGNCNLAAFKISLDLSGIEAQFRPLDIVNRPLLFTGCAPLTVNFDNRSITTPGTKYFWDFGDGGASSQFEPKHIFRTPGTWKVQLIIEDSASCNIRDTTYADIIVYPPPTVATGPDEIICKGDSVAISAVGSGGVVKYQWQPNSNILNRDSTSAIVFPTNDFSYRVQVTDSNGCRAIDTIKVSIDRSLIVNARPDTVICEGISARLFASHSNGVSFSWTPANTINNPNILAPVASPDTTTTYVITAVNARGCEEKDSTTIEVFEVYTLEDTSLCIGDTILMRTTNGVRFEWRPAYNMDNPNAASPLVWPTLDTTYIVRATSQDGCISEKGVEVLIHQLPPADAGVDDTVCVGFSTVLQASGGIDFLWSPSDFVDDPTKITPLATPPNTTIFYVTVTDTNGCHKDDSVEVLVNSLPTIIASPQTTICEGDSIQLIATGGVRYTWQFDPSLSAFDVPDPIAKPDVPTLYLVTGTDANGCVNDTTVAIDITQRPIVDIEGDNFICIGGEIELTAIGGEWVRWNSGDTNRTIGVLPVEPTTYYVTSFIGSCEGETDSITVDVFFDYPTADFVYDPASGWAPQPVQFTNASQGADRYVWDFGTGAGTSDEVNPLYTFPFAGDWTVMLIAYSNTGCADTAYNKVLLENVALHVPSAFSPNDDGFNDFFYVGYYGIQSLNFRIFSRWGMKVYESDDKDFRWDALYKGQHVPEGVYVWVAEGIGENGLTYNRTGTVTVIR